jgi:hypothetical protein
MAGWPEPSSPDRPPESPPDPDSPFEEPPFERPPFGQDPEAQHAPGAGQEDRDSQQPPMQATAGGSTADPDDVILLDAPGVARDPVGNDNIREGRVNGVMGPPHASGGQGQGG